MITILRRYRNRHNEKGAVLPLTVAVTAGVFIMVMSLMSILLLSIQTSADSRLSAEEVSKVESARDSALEMVTDTTSACSPTGAGDGYSYEIYSGSSAAPTKDNYETELKPSALACPTNVSAWMGIVVDSVDKKGLPLKKIVTVYDWIDSRSIVYTPFMFADRGFILDGETGETVINSPSPSDAKIMAKGTSDYKPSGWTTKPTSGLNCVSAVVNASPIVKEINRNIPLATADGCKITGETQHLSTTMAIDTSKVKLSSLCTLAQGVVGSEAGISPFKKNGPCGSYPDESLESLKQDTISPTVDRITCTPVANAITTTCLANTLPDLTRPTILGNSVENGPFYMSASTSADIEISTDVTIWVKCGTIRGVNFKSADGEKHNVNFITDTTSVTSSGLTVDNVTMDSNISGLFWAKNELTIQDSKLNGQFISRANGVKVLNSELNYEEISLPTANTEIGDVSKLMKAKDLKQLNQFEISR